MNKFIFLALCCLLFGKTYPSVQYIYGPSDPFVANVDTLYISGSSSEYPFQFSGNFNNNKGLVIFGPGCNLSSQDSLYPANNRLSAVGIFNRNIPFSSGNKDTSYYSTVEGRWVEYTIPYFTYNYGLTFKSQDPRNWMYFRFNSNKLIDDRSLDIVYNNCSFENSRFQNAELTQFSVDFKNCSFKNCQTLWYYPEEVVNSILDTQSPPTAPPIPRIDYIRVRHKNADSIIVAMKVCKDEYVRARYGIDGDGRIFGGGTLVPVQTTGDSVLLAINTSQLNLAAGSHTVYVTLCNAKGVWSFIQHEVFCGKTNTAFAINKSIVCDKGFVQFTNLTKGNEAGAVFSWDYNGDGVVDYTGANNSTWYYETAGTYKPTLTVSEANSSCAISHQDVKIIVSQPTVTISNNPPAELYIKDSLVLKAEASSPLGISGIKWTSTASITPDTAYTVKFTAKTPSTYVVKALVTDKGGCTGSQVTSVSVLPLIENFIVKDSMVAYGPKANIIQTQYLTPTSTVKWESSNPSIAMVNAAGMVQCVSNGFATIKGTADGKYTDQIVVQVKPYTALNNILVQESAGLQLNGNALNNVIVFIPNNASIQTVKWYTSDSSVAVVDQKGTITPKGEGTCNIVVVADDGNIPAVTFVTVKGLPVAVDSVTAPDTLYVTVGEKVKINADIYPYFASNKTLQWVSTATSIAIVDNEGMVTAKSVGDAPIIINPAQGNPAVTVVAVRNSHAPVFSLPSVLTYYLENSNWSIKLSKYLTDDITKFNDLQISLSPLTNLDVTLAADSTLRFTNRVANWKGSEIFTISATDADGLKTTKQIEIVVSGTPNQAPQLYFPAITQTAASAVSLTVAEYVTDDRDAVSALTITAKNSGASTVSIASGLLQIAPASASWTGVDTITITAVDSKLATSTQKIIYTVKAQQTATAPVVQEIPVQYSNSFGEFADLYLNRYVKDAATMPEQILWETSPSFKLDVRIKNNVLTAAPVDINWVGSERVQLIATNALGLRDTAELIFIKQNAEEVKWEGSAEIDFFAERTIANRGSNITFYPSMTGARSWKWIVTGEGDTITSQALYPNLQFTKNGVYSVSLVCQTKTNRDTLTAKNYISIFGISPADTTICQGASVKLKIATAGLDSWKWSTGSTDNIISVSPTKTTTYKVHVVKDLFEYDDSIKITINNPVSLGTDFTLCEKASKTLDAPAYKTLYWNGSTTAAASFTASSKGEITVRAVDAGGCESKDTVVVTEVLPLPVTEVASSASICDGAAATLVSKNGVSYQWSNADKSITSINDSLKVTAIGKYYVKTTAANGCSVLDSVSVIVNKRPTVTAQASTANSICGGDSVSISASGALQYVLSNSAKLTERFPVYTVGNNLIKVIGSDANGCTDTAEVTIVVKTTPDLLVASHGATVCTGASLKLEATGASTITWDHGVVNAQSFVPTVAGKYVATGINSEGCSDTATVYVIINPLPTVTATPKDTVICLNKTVTLTGAGARTYEWSGGVVNKQAFAPKETGTYTVTGTDFYGCKATASVKVSVLKPTAEQIGVVTYDSTFGKKVIIAWNRHKGFRTERYVVYRDNGAMGWDSIAGVKFNDSALIYDTQANLDVKAYRYKLETIDSTCHNRDSCIHRTMHVTASPQTGGYEVKWNRYIGFNTKSYQVIRINPDKTITPIATQSGDAEFLTVSDLHPVNGGEYRVLYKLPEDVYPKLTKTDTGPFSQSFSNMSEASLVSDSETLRDGVSIYPNPAKAQINISAENAEGALVSLIASNGAVVAKTSVANGKAQFMVESFAKGIYTVQLQTNDKAVSEQVVVE